jgi:peptidoglycan-associated lipoprotein
MQLLSYAMSAIIIIGVMLTGCTKKAVQSEMMGEELKSKETASTVSETPQTKPVEEEVSQAAVKEVAAIAIGDIFFDYDRFSIRDDAKPILEDNARYLKANKNLKVVIEGHCDERGAAEYNIALGERRASAAQKYLTDLGIDQSRISIVSYGKEKPFCADHNEQCWQENRRAHFVTK